MEDAFEASLRLLRHRDLPEAEVRRRLHARGFGSAECEDALERLVSTGVVDDARFALLRASSLAARGAGDALIRDDLERGGIPGETIDEALAALEPERDRARAIVRRRGAGPRTVRYLRGKGFAAESVETLVADTSAEELG